MSKFVPTDSILDKILSHKVTEIKDRMDGTPLDTLQTMARRVSKPLDFAGALRRDDDRVALIAEVKKASPSKGVLLDDFAPVDIARTYAENGASAVSVLTDETFFQGHLSYLEQINEHTEIPTLRKDFIIDPYQVYEARIARADAVLLIVAALTDAQLRELHALIEDLKMSALVEVHNEDELQRALTIGATLIGINNRDLKTFEVNLETTQRLAQQVPQDVTLVAESGIKSAADVRQMGASGAHAVLVGESLVTADDIAAATRELSLQATDE
jgi:indole-3-glycerol phosphate synthase